MVKKSTRMPRCYHQVARAQTADETRRQIVSAARVCILDQGFQNMRVEDVATAAGVARASVFRHFRNKAEILRAVEIDAAERAGVMRLVGRMNTMAPREALLAAIREGTRIWAAEARVFREFYGTAPFDDTLRPLVAEKEALRHTMVSNLLVRVEAAGLLQSGAANLQTIVHAVWLLTGFGAFDTLTRVQGLSTKAATEVIEKVIGSAFLKE